MNAGSPGRARPVSVSLIGPVLALLLAAGGPSLAGEHPTLIPVRTPQGATLSVELADTTEKRVRGLMFRTTLPRDRGMLFAFEEAQAWTIWMKNTWIPLDILWLDIDKRIVHIEPNVPPCFRNDNGCPQYQPLKPALFVLELAAGTAADLGLKQGAQLAFPVDPPWYLRPR